MFLKCSLHPKALVLRCLPIPLEKAEIPVQSAKRDLRETFEQHAASRPLNLNPELNDDGLRLGAGTLVLEARQDGRDRDERSAALLAAAYKRSFTTDAIVI